MGALLLLIWQAQVHAADAEARHPVTKSTVILVQSVVDDRKYLEFPSDPNDHTSRPRDETVPTVRRLSDAQASAYIKARAFARAGAGDGGVLGEIVLDDGKTVADLVRDNIVAALREAGFRATINAAEAGRSPLVLKVRITQFWSWHGPDWWNGDIETAIETSFEAGGAVAVPAIKVQADYVLQGGDGDDERYWMKSVNLALTSYRAQVGDAFSRAFSRAFPRAFSRVP